MGPGAAAPIPFLHTAGPFASAEAAVDIGTITRLVLQNNGDGIVLPDSAEASVTSTEQVPALPPWGLALFVLTLMGTGVLILRRS